MRQVGHHFLIAWLVLGSSACRGRSDAAPDPAIGTGEPQSAPLRPVGAGSERRFALVLGNNRGMDSRPDLAYAESDAENVAEVFAELSGVRPEDLFVEKGARTAKWREALVRIAEAIREARAHAADSRSVLLFYFSGHSDGMVITLGDERVGFADVRRALQETGADARVAILDACKSGDAIGVKGGTPGGGFEMRLLEGTALNGEALLSSTASSELALESKALGGSFFTHYLLSGLRGAADADSDARVTLNEAHRYAAARTHAATAKTTYGPQSPSFDYRLIGQTELVLADFRAPHSSISLLAGFDQLTIRDEATGRFLADLDATSALRIALPPGAYLVSGHYGNRRMGTRMVLGKDQGLMTPPLQPLDAEAKDPLVREESASAAVDNIKKDKPDFCEGTEGQWKGCRGSGCMVCSELIANYPFYLRNHPNCLPAMTCEGRRFECSANCPAPSIKDTCAADGNGWRGCFSGPGCAVCSELVEAFPKYFERHPNCVPIPGKCKGTYFPCSVNCPQPGPEDQ